MFSDEESHDATLIEAQFPNMSLYAILGADKGADEAALKKAFRKSALKHHPDKGGDPELFKAMCAAHAVLADPERRAVYDETGDISSAGGASGQGKDFGSTPPPSFTTPYPISFYVPD